ncbi:MAG: ABC transporter ATP-binding protein [Pseudomonadaceae bacterium]|nr:ABC transporter ATP-binding protein [Pseudomonadaceae bacterium]
MSRIDIHNLWKSYDSNVVLENLNLSIDHGDFVSIVGASGCGKTTFLRMILGEEQPSRGSIDIDGEALQPEPSSARGIVFQRYSVFPHLTVLGNVLLALEMSHAKYLCRSFGARRKEQVKRSQQMLERVGLTDAKDQYPSALSGGMQQRLALCQALIAAPKILLLDEPFGALDPGIRKDMQSLVRQLHRELGLTVIMITHDLAEGFQLGTRLLVFDKTRVDPQAPNLYGANITYDLRLNSLSTESTTQIDSQETQCSHDANTQALMV